MSSVGPSAAGQSGPISFFALKHDHMFVVADAIGDVLGSSDGLFKDDTRMLSRFGLTVGGVPPALLSSGLSSDNVFFRANLANRPLPQLGGSEATPEGVVHIERSRFIWEERLFERLALTNYGERTVSLPLALSFGADFVDIFEVRGLVRSRRGQLRPAAVVGEHAELSYEGLDGQVRRCVIAFSRTPDRLQADRAEFTVVLPRRTSEELFVEVGSELVELPGRTRFRACAAGARLHMRRKRRRGAGVRTWNTRFDRWLQRSRADLALLETDLETGPYPFAGIPWFSTPFGRDAVITALQTLWLDPALARGVLSFLARHQARDVSPVADSEPGKILHETRRGEMSTLEEVPFGRYYGGVDTTPLFVMLAGAYAVRTSDMELIGQLWPALLAAMRWVDGRAAASPHGLVDYLRASERGLANQGWKDSFDSIFHEDGRLPSGPIALLEVQGYVYAARLAMAELAALRGDPAGSREWASAAEAGRQTVERRYWMPEHQFYGIALDGDGQLCRVCASNAGHLLFVGLPSHRRARHVTEQLLSPSFDNGWGTRTVRDQAARFNPMSYHNGTVWPHDTSLCAAGMARYGHRAAARHLLQQSFAAATHFGMRLPELLCGFSRRIGEPPVGYPVACLPQAWSSGAVFLMLQATLGVQLDAGRREILIDRPELPHDVEHLDITGLEINDEKVDLHFRRRAGRVVVQTTLSRPGSVRVSVTS
jgi:glycogen debranching enzyme